MQVTNDQLDIAKNVFHVYVIDAAETVVVRKQLRRGQRLAFFKVLSPCLVGMATCDLVAPWPFVGKANPGRGATFHFTLPSTSEGSGARRRDVITE